MSNIEKRTVPRRVVGGPFDGQTIEASVNYDQFTIHPTDQSLVPAMGGSRASHYELQDGALIWHERTA